MSISDPPAPESLADKLRHIPTGESRVFRWDEARPSAIRSTITRIKRGDDTLGYNYTTRPEGDNMRVWRLS